MTAYRILLVDDNLVRKLLPHLNLMGFDRIQATAVPRPQAMRWSEPMPKANPSL
jgi:hypothetical protein